MQLETSILSEVNQKEKYDITYVESKKWYNELIYKTETYSQTSKTNIWLPKRKGGGRDKLGVWD